MRCGGVVLTIVALSAATSVADAGTMTAKDKAYTLTLVCVTVAANDENEGDHSRALDAARKMAKAQGYSTKRLSDDLFNTATVLGVKLRTDPGSMDRNREICRRLKLIS